MAAEVGRLLLVFWESRSRLEEDEAVESCPVAVEVVCSADVTEEQDADGPVGGPGGNAGGKEVI